MKSTNVAHVIIHALWLGPGPAMFEAVANFASAPRGELFMYASRSATRCSSGGAVEADGVCACNEESNAMVPTSNRSRIITRVSYRHANFLPARKMALGDFF